LSTTIEEWFILPVPPQLLTLNLFLWFYFWSPIPAFVHKMHPIVLQVSTGAVLNVTDAREEKSLSPWVQLPVKIVRRENTATALGQEKRAEIAR
jgi:hypothetical protein